MGQPGPMECSTPVLGGAIPYMKVGTCAPRRGGHGYQGLHSGLTLSTARVSLGQTLAASTFETAYTVLEPPLRYTRCASPPDLLPNALPIHRKRSMEP
jgi:hypothetical protein